MLNQEFVSFRSCVRECVRAVGLLDEAVVPFRFLVLLLLLLLVACGLSWARSGPALGPLWARSGLALGSI